MTTELKPCPFCGSDNLILENADPYEWVFCEVCESAGPARMGEGEAEKAWNTRTEPEESE